MHLRHFFPRNNPRDPFFAVIHVCCGCRRQLWQQRRRRRRQSRRSSLRWRRQRRCWHRRRPSPPPPACCRPCPRSCRMAASGRPRPSSACSPPLPRLALRSHLSDQSPAPGLHGTTSEPLAFPSLGSLCCADIHCSSRFQITVADSRCALRCFLFVKRV